MGHCYSFCNCPLIAALQGTCVSMGGHSHKLCWSLLRVYPGAKFDFMPWRNRSHVLVPGMLEFLPSCQHLYFRMADSAGPWMILPIRKLSPSSAVTSSEPDFITAQIPGFLKSLSIPTSVTPDLWPRMPRDWIATLRSMTRVSKLLCTWHCHWFCRVVLDKLTCGCLQCRTMKFCKILNGLQQCKDFPFKEFS